MSIVLEPVDEDSVNVRDFKFESICMSCVGGELVYFFQGVLNFGVRLCRESFISVVGWLVGWNVRLWKGPFISIVGWLVGWNFNLVISWLVGWGVTESEWLSRRVFVVASICFPQTDVPKKFFD